MCQRSEKVGTRGRPGRSFCITISPVLPCKEIREDFVEWFEGVESYCVGVEKHHTSGRYHLHAYIKFLEARGILSVRVAGTRTPTPWSSSP
jgi:hypothetical protein